MNAGEDGTAGAGAGAGAGSGAGSGGATRRRSLGRGLSALFGEEEGASPGVGAADPAQRDGAGMGVGEPAPRAGKMVPIGYLKPNPRQPRRRFDETAIDALVASIRERGILQPILVRRHPAEANAYEIVAGERRWRAAQRAQLHEVPVLIRELTDGEAFELALIENIAREDLTPLEEAEGFRRLIEQFGHTQDSIARSVGKSRSHIANQLRLLTLPENVRAMLDDGRLTPGQARPLVGRADAEALAETVVARGLNARAVESLVRAPKQKDAGDGEGGATPSVARRMERLGQAVEKDADTKAVERDLEDRLGMRVDIALAGEGGSLTIRFADFDQLDGLIARLTRPVGPGSGGVVEM